ncbi:uncharacterized protein EDB91DRAFT_1236322 [Suillus paluster]|uniref:uncharacterized protein n=1 Tax=Suillus paluster TaxID=48578 RepID=UPI001B860713|nr:uncharacterized protein EDB91DRAFT_1236322 [Suillus paluster]KAG1745379.1 hypothetical protein EDB91DRAFT_1236322 [Suillus paluster]
MPELNDYSFSINTVDIFTLSTRTTFHRLEDSISPVQSLISTGFLGNAPHNPSIAISLRTLEHYRLLHLRKPSLSIEAFTKVICDSYLIAYCRSYRTALADSFDVYLTILHEVGRRVDTALGRDTPNWRVLNACPPCSHELNGEPPLKFTCMYMMDGGNSAKHMMGIGDRQCGDTQVYTESDYMLPRTFIDHFTNEVLQPCSAHRVNDRLAPDDDIVSDAEEDVSRAHIVADDCSKNWKAAADNDNKRMWAIFNETGIFIAACRHGFILWHADMIKSGELAKYPLAIVAKVLEVIGERTLGAYDIGCGFSSTVCALSLGTTFTEMQSRLCVDSFHDYAHNYVCQTQHHPLGIEGTGLEDFGIAKHIFSASNALSPVIHYASAYHCHMFLDLFFKQWDEDKYANLGTMLLNNYRQALRIISLETVALEEAKTSLGVQDSDLVDWRAEEIQYFWTLGKEPEWDAHAVVYVELLQQMQELKCQASASFNRFVSAALNDYQFTAVSESNFYSANLSQTRKLETQQHFAAKHFAVIQRKVISMEIKLGIANCWNISSPEYQDTLKYMTLRKYHKALNNLQHLVVQQLFELQRLNVSQTAIQNAVKKYNEVASELQPPWPPLECFLDEFNLLRETWQDICEKPWTKPVVQETIRQYLRIQRAKEEIIRCNVEVCRLHTAIVGENEAFARILDALKTSNSPIFVVIHCLDAFSGDKSSGIRKGSDSVEVPSTVTTDQPLENDETEEGLDEDDEVERDIGTLVEFISDMALCP